NPSLSGHCTRRADMLDHHVAMLNRSIRVAGMLCTLQLGDVVLHNVHQALPRGLCTLISRDLVKPSLHALGVVIDKACDGLASVLRGLTRLSRPTFGIS